MKSIRKCLALLLPMYPFKLLIYILLMLPTTILPAILLYLEKKIVDSAASLSSFPTLEKHGVWILLLMLTFAVWKAFEIIARQYMEFGYFRYITLGLDKTIHDTCAALSLECYDDAKTFQHIEEAKEASMFLIFTTNIVVQILFILFTIFSIGSYLVLLNPVLFFLVFLLTIPALLEKFQEAKYQALRLKNSMQPQREKKYYFSLLANAKTKKEIAIHGADRVIANKFLEACKSFDLLEKKFLRITCGIGISISFVKMFIRGISLALMIFLLMTSKITIGGFSVVMTSYLMIGNTFSSLFAFAGEVIKTGKMSASFFDLLEMRREQKNSETANSIKNKQGKFDVGKQFLRFENVSYRYPGTEKEVLQKITMSVNYGDILAIVGSNGAGKSTLAKLMSGFLMPAEGELYFNEQKREAYQEEDIFKNISALYQEYGKYMLSIADNIHLSDSEKPKDLKCVEQAINWAGFPIKKQQVETTFIGKEFGGIDLSGGEWQRIALARCYYRDRPIVFFDEPTAAIDPLQEVALYEKIKELAKGKTVILVTHRLGMIKSADKVVVLNNGSITEEGNFESLMRSKGEFANMWNEQLKWYEGDKNEDSALS